MSRDPGLYLQDIDAACEKVRLLVEGIDFDTFTDEWRTRDAVLHNLKVLGDAVRRLPPSRLPRGGLRGRGSVILRCSPTRG